MPGLCTRECVGGHVQLPACLCSLQPGHHPTPTALPGCGAAVGAEQQWWREKWRSSRKAAMKMAPPTSSPVPPAPVLPLLGGLWCHMPWQGRRGFQPCTHQPGNDLCPSCRAWAGSGCGYFHVLHPPGTLWSPEGKGESLCLGHVRGNQGLGSNSVLPPPWGFVLPLCPSRSTGQVHVCPRAGEQQGLCSPLFEAPRC